MEIIVNNKYETFTQELNQKKTQFKRFKILFLGKMI